MVERRHTRRPGFFEKQYICRNIGGFYSNFNVTGKFGGSVRITPGNLSHSLRAWLEHMDFWLVYNFYRVDDSIEDEEADGSNFEVRPVTKLSFDSVVEFQTIESFDSGTLEWLNDLRPPMNTENGALWKVYVFDSQNDGKQYMTFVCDHALLDGMCGAEFHKTMPKYLNQKWDETEPLINIFDYELDKHLLGDTILGPRELMSDLFQLSYWQTATYYLTKWAKIYLPQVASEYLGLQETIDPPVFLGSTIEKDTRSKFKMFNLTPDQLKILRGVCKRYNLTLTPVVHTIALYTLENTLIKTVSKTGNQPSSCTCIAVNGRKHIPQTKTQGFIYGCLVSATVHNDPPLPLALSTGNKTNNINDIMPLLLPRMNQYLNQIIDNQKSLLSFKQYGGFGALTNAWKAYKAIPGTKQRYTLLNSNLGFIDPGTRPESHFILEDSFFASSTCLKYHVITNFTSTAIGGLSVVIAYLPEYDLLIDDFVFQYKESLLALR
ncbi:uncharacterized protein KQ657_002559 [Scheffersomyces spartinae]|uniref:Alcohol acetyltransferase n=1 Tax=Scheffersomyces spartinae TaxID=45513 RepID=A0A9P8AHA7_9ASCO|nr:uncharacterized protein KQ657_002559 [Scheffersomyces spartinae]KAG7191953.1 hypothetical protein KQ657_002559 [Scheffersomyces spartinae]